MWDRTINIPITNQTHYQLVYEAPLEIIFNFNWKKYCEINNHFKRCFIAEWIMGLVCNLEVDSLIPHF